MSETTSEIWREVVHEVRLLLASWLFGGAAKVAPTDHPDGLDLNVSHFEWTARCVRRERERRALLPPREPEGGA